MEPTLVPGERVLMDSAWYRLSSPKRGEYHRVPDE